MLERKSQNGHSYWGREGGEPSKTTKLHKLPRQAYSIKPSGRLLEAEMASDVGVERIVEQQFLFHCSCGATIETSEKKETCWNCHASIEVLGCVQTSHGKKYTLRIRKQRREEETERLLHPRGSTAITSRRHHQQEPNYDIPPRCTDPAQAIRHRREGRDMEKQCMRLGLAILSAPFWIPLLLAILFSVANGSRAPVEQDGPNPRIIGPGPEPTDCGWFSSCHYEKRAVRIRDNHGLHIIVTWQRVND
jgi:hypothetical protein